MIFDAQIASLQEHCTNADTSFILTWYRDLQIINNWIMICLTAGFGSFLSWSQEGIEIQESLRDELGVGITDLGIGNEARARFRTLTLFLDICLLHPHLHNLTIPSSLPKLHQRKPRRYHWPQAPACLAPRGDASHHGATERWLRETRPRRGCIR